LGLICYDASACVTGREPPTFQKIYHAVLRAITLVFEEEKVKRACFFLQASITFGGRGINLSSFKAKP
jgi:hypothetical protein